MTTRRAECTCGMSLAEEPNTTILVPTLQTYSIQTVSWTEYDRNGTPHQRTQQAPVYGPGEALATECSRCGMVYMEEEMES